MSVIAALELTRGVKEVFVNLYLGRAAVCHGPPCGAAQLVKAVKRAGYGASIVEEAAHGEGAIGTSAPV